MNRAKCSKKSAKKDSKSPLETYLMYTKVTRKVNILLVISYPNISAIVQIVNVVFEILKQATKLKKKTLVIY